MTSKKAQVAIWVIAGVVIAALILILVFMQREKISSVFEETFSPQADIRNCVETAIEEAAEKMIPQGGFLEPTNYIMYNYTKVPYICAHYGYLMPCINQHPMLIGEIKKQISEYASPKIEECFESVKKKAGDKNFQVEMGEMNIDIGLASKRIYADISRSIVFRSDKETIVFNSTKAETVNMIYDLANIALEIANDEAKYCDFDNVAFMALHPDFRVTKFRFSDSTEIYSITEKEKGKTMNIAIRSCSMLHGTI